MHILKILTYEDKYGCHSQERGKIHRRLLKVLGKPDAET
jgi:hypothetical protein